MDITTVVQLITTVGFPIAVCIFMGWFYVQRLDKQDAKDEKLNEILNNFSLNIQSNTELLKQIQEDLKSNKEGK